MKKYLSILLAMCMVLALMAGCGAAKEEPPAETQAAAPAAAETEKAAEPEAEEVVTITVMRTGTPEVLHEIFDPLLVKFEEEYPNIKIDMQDLGWSDAEKTLQTMSASKTLPDVMYHLPPTIFDLADKGLILDLTDYVDDELKEDMYPAMMEAGQYNGKQYMISCGGSTLNMWYNADLFRQAGLDPDNPPKTWPEFLEACETLSTIDGITPVGMYTSPVGGETSFVFESLFTSQIGGTAWDAENNRYFYDSEEYKDDAIKTMQFMQDMTQYAQEGYVEFGRFDCRTLLRDGKVAIVFDLINMANVVPDQLEAGTIRVADVPCGDSGIQSSAVNVGGWFIPTNCEHPDEAWTFLRYMMRTENQKEHARYGAVPMLKSEASTYTDGYIMGIINSLEHAYPEGVCTKTNALWTATGENLQLLLMGETSAEETWENLSSEHMDIYNK